MRKLRFFIAANHEIFRERVKIHLNKNIIVSSIFLLAFSIQKNTAQEIKSGNDTLAPIINEAQSDLKKLKKIKITGYIQGQYQKAQSKGIETTSGENFPSGIDQRFSIRRGRLKTIYNGKLSEIAIQFDFPVDKGVVALKEAYFKFTEPLLKTVSLQVGLFNRPFGFEIGFSSTAMEAPERSRVTQTIFPGETDLGACLVFQLPKENPLNAFRIDAGLFNGTNNKPDFDNVKDFIGRLSYNNSLLNKYLALGAGVSYYSGGTWNFAPNYYKWNNNAYQSIAIDSLGTLKRKYMGADAQISLDNSFGQTIIRGEMLWGTQPAPGSKSKTQLEAIAVPLYIRNFSGGYAYFVQSVLKTKHQFVAKYEWYDPNTKTDKTKIGVIGTETTKADIAYNTLGIGWIYNWDNNIKITAYYDITSNEKTSLANYSKDLKDNVFTFRIQYKF